MLKARTSRPRNVKSPVPKEGAAHQGFARHGAMAECRHDVKKRRCSASHPLPVRSRAWLQPCWERSNHWIADPFPRRMSLAEAQLGRFPGSRACEFPAFPSLVRNSGIWSSPRYTVAGPRRIYTGFPFNPASGRLTPNAGHLLADTVLSIESSSFHSGDYTTASVWTLRL